MSAADVFLSYSSLDAALAHRLAIDLRARGIDVWIDQWALQVGEEFWPHIERAVCSAQKLLVLVSSSSVASGWVEKEWTQKGVGKGLVIPVLCERCDMPDGIASQDAVDISGGSYWAGLAQLIDIIRPNNSVELEPASQDRRRFLPLPEPISVEVSKDLCDQIETINDPNSPLARDIVALQERVFGLTGVPFGGVRFRSIESEQVEKTMIFFVEGRLIVPIVAKPTENFVSLLIDQLEKVMVENAELFIEPDRAARILSQQGLPDPTPERACWSEIVEIMRAMLRNKLPLMDFRRVMDLLPEHRERPIEIEGVVEDIRPFHSELLSRRVMDTNGTIHAITLAPESEAVILQSMRKDLPFAYSELDPVWSGKIHEGVRRLQKLSGVTVLIVKSPEIRPLVDRMIFSEVAVLARREVDPQAFVQEVAIVPHVAAEIQ